MSAARTPDLPEDFGNPWMSNLQEITPPDPVPFTPQTIGWHLLAAVVILGLLWLAWRGWQRWRANAYRRAALAELAEIRFPQEIPELLKRVALVAYPRAEVAELSGEAWLGFLDGTLGTTDFTQGVGRWLPRLAYDPGSTGRMNDTEGKNLLTLVRKWIQKHHGAERPVRRPAASRTTAGRLDRNAMGTEQG